MGVAATRGARTAERTATRASIVGNVVREWWWWSMSVCRGEQVGWVYETDATARRDRLDGRLRKSQSRLAGTSRHPPTVVTPAGHVTPHPSSASTMSSAVLRQASIAVRLSLVAVARCVRRQMGWNADGVNDRLVRSRARALSRPLRSRGKVRACVGVSVAGLAQPDELLLPGCCRPTM